MQEIGVWKGRRFLGEFCGRVETVWGMGWERSWGCWLDKEDGMKFGVGVLWEELGWMEGRRGGIEVEKRAVRRPCGVENICMSGG